MFCVGFLLGAGFLLLPIRPWPGSLRRWVTPDGMAFLSLPQTQLWVALIGLQSGLWALALGPLWGSLNRMRKLGRWPHPATATLVGLAAVLSFEWLVAGRLGIRFHYPISGASYKLPVLTLVAGLAAPPGLAAIVVARHRVECAFQAVEPTEDEVRSFLAYRTEVLQVLRLLGAFIGLATLATGALRNAIAAALVPATRAHLALSAGDFHEIPVQMVWAFGGFFTLILALAYVPTHLALHVAGDRIAARLAPLSLFVTDPSAYQSRRAAADATLGLASTWGDALRTALPVLAPISAAALSVLLGTTT